MMYLSLAWFQEDSSNEGSNICLMQNMVNYSEVIAVTPFYQTEIQGSTCEANLLPSPI